VLQLRRTKYGTQVKYGVCVIAPNIKLLHPADTDIPESLLSLSYLQFTLSVNSVPCCLWSIHYTL